MAKKQGGSPKLNRSSHLKGKWQMLRDRKTREHNKAQAIRRDEHRKAAKAHRTIKVPRGTTRFKRRHPAHKQP